MPNIRWIGADFPLHMSDFPSDSAPAPRLSSIFRLHLIAEYATLHGCLAGLPSDDAQRVLDFMIDGRALQDIQDKQDWNDKQDREILVLRRVRSCKLSCWFFASC